MLILVQILTTIAGILIFYLCLLPLILIHELGHLAAGRACGLALVKFRVGPIELARRNVLQLREPLRLHWSWKSRHFCSGRIVMFAGQTSLARSGPAFCIYLLGGPFGNLGSALLALPIALQDTMAGGIAKYFVIVSVLLGAGNLIPFGRDGLESDGSQLWGLLLDKKKREARLYMFTLAARLEQIRTLYANGRIEEACDWADQVIREGEGMPYLSAEGEFRQRLSAFRDVFQRARASIAGAEQEGPEQAVKLPE